MDFITKLAHEYCQCVIMFCHCSFGGMVNLVAMFVHQ